MQEYDVGKRDGRLSYDLENIDYDQRKEDKKKLKKSIKRLIVSAVVIVPCLIFGLIMYNGYIRTNKAYSEIERNYVDLAMSYAGTYEENESEDNNMQRNIDFASLTAKENDIYAWIYMPNSNIDYPILQSGEGVEDDYWLNHNLDGSTGYPGTIFTEKMFGTDFKTFNTVIYGHNMKNQTMFGSLHNFEENEDYFKKHEYVYIYTKYMTYKYQVICASTISDIHLALAYNGYDTESQRQQFLDYLLSKASFSRGDVKMGIYDSYITLSTCTNSDVNRFVVLAKCVEKISNRDYD